MNDLPKRRKDKYNPYSFKKMDIDDKYIISFTNNNNEIELEISKELYSVFNNFELSDLSIMNEFDRHIEHSKLNENTLNKRIFNVERGVEDIVINKIEKQKLHIAIDSLPLKQKNRIQKYFFENLTQKEIAKIENCSIRAIQYSIECALKNLKNFLN
ncbi:MAG: sigma-70 family RNA polymerase sigma factor [Clostridia bacterium]